MSEPAKLLFVCHANVCRSPLAEGVFRHLVAQARMEDRFRIDSAGTFAMEGAPPHPKSVAAATEHGIRLEGQSRQLSRHDLSTFDHVLVMDRQNLLELERLAAPSAFGPLDDYHANIRMIAAAGSEGQLGPDVRDPIGKGLPAYRETYKQLLGHCTRLLAEFQ